MYRTPVIFAGSNCLSGVTTWAERLRHHLADHPRYELLLLNVGRKRPEGVDLSVRNVAAAQRLLREMAPVIVLPNYLWELYLAGFQPGVHCLGMCHADSDEQYYRPLSWYEPVISQFIAVSPECSERLTNRIPARTQDITTLPYGIDVPRTISRAYQTRPLRIIYAGRITQLQKRVWDFVPLVERLQAYQVPFEFSLVGDGDEREALQHAMAERFPAASIRFHGRVPHGAMPALWRSHDVFVQTSDFEGTSISMLESMAHGVVPVVTAASSGVAGVIVPGRNGFIAPVGDMDGLARAVACLAADRALLAAAGAAAHRTAQGYSMEKYADRFVDVLDRALAPIGQFELQERYGMFASAHPLFKQRQMIAGLEWQLARRDKTILRRIARYFRPRLRARPVHAPFPPRLQTHRSIGDKRSAA